MKVQKLYQHSTNPNPAPKIPKQVQIFNYHHRKNKMGNGNSLFGELLQKIERNDLINDCSMKNVGFRGNEQCVKEKRTFGQVLGAKGRRQGAKGDFAVRGRAKIDKQIIYCSNRNNEVLEKNNEIDNILTPNTFKQAKQLKQWTDKKTKYLLKPQTLRSITQQSQKQNIFLNSVKKINTQLALKIAIKTDRALKSTAKKFKCKTQYSDKLGVTPSSRAFRELFGDH